MVLTSGTQQAFKSAAEIAPQDAALVGATMRELECRIVAANLAAFNGNKTKTARALGITRIHLNDCIKRGGLLAFADPEVSPGSLRRELVKNFLSMREADVAEQVAKGLTSLQVADELRISEKTVKFHLTNIYKKLPAKTRSQLLVWCRPHIETV